jgi:D-glycero-D-manno-heptose 1,7-bisphosphate phosphatase
MLDRDGVINVDRPTSVRSWEEFTFLPSVENAIHALNQAHIPVAIITNQAIVGRNELSLTDLNYIHHQMQKNLAKKGAYIDHIFFCTDTTIEPHYRRKPAPGMILEALKHFNARPAYSYMIGDALRDLEAAYRAECQRILVRTGKGFTTEKEGIPHFLDPVSIYDDLLVAVEALLEKLDDSSATAYTVEHH